MTRHLILMTAVAVMAASVGYYVARTLSPPQNAALAPERLTPGGVPTPAPQDLIGQRRPDFRLADAEGRYVSVDRFDGRVLLLNFWATWCTPCVEEMPMLARLQREFAGQGVNVVGIALDEPGRAQQFARELGIDYPLLFGREDAMLAARRYGNDTGMLPYTVLMDAGGVIRWNHLGVLDRAQLETQLTSVR